MCRTPATWTSQDGNDTRLHVSLDSSTDMHALVKTSARVALLSVNMVPASQHQWAVGAQALTNTRADALLLNGWDARVLEVVNHMPGVRALKVDLPRPGYSIFRPPLAPSPCPPLVCKDLEFVHLPASMAPVKLPNSVKKAIIGEWDSFTSECFWRPDHLPAQLEALSAPLDLLVQVRADTRFVFIKNIMECWHSTCSDVEHVLERARTAPHQGLWVVSLSMEGWETDDHELNVDFFDDAIDVDLGAGGRVKFFLRDNSDRFLLRDSMDRFDLIRERVQQAHPDWECEYACGDDGDDYAYVFEDWMWLHELAQGGDGASSSDSG